MSKTLLAFSFLGVIFLAGCNLKQYSQNAGPLMQDSTSDTMKQSDTMQDPDSAIQEGDSMKDNNMIQQGEPVTKNVREITIDMFPFGYSVEEITSAPGEILQITLTNSEGTHDFDIDELDIDTPVIAQGETGMASVEIPEDAKPGTTYTYYCSVGNHRAQGMEGKIIIQ